MTFQNCGFNDETNLDLESSAHHLRIMSLSITNFSFLRSDLASSLTSIRSFKLRRPDLPEQVWPRDSVEELQVFLMECQCLEHVDMRGVYDAIDERLLAAIGKNLLSLRITSAKLSPEIIGRYCPRLRTLGTDVVEGDNWLDCVI